MFCKQCGEKNDSDAKFCTKCGISFGGDRVTEKEEEKQKIERSDKKKKKVIPIVVGAGIVALGAFGFFAYKNKISIMGFGDDKTNKAVLLAKVETRKGHIQTPEYIKPETLVIVGLGNPSKVDTKGDFETSAYAEGVTNVVAMLPKKEFGLMDVVIGKEIPELTLQSTVEALVFMAPQLVSSDPKKSEEILTVIRKDEAVANLAKDLDRLLKENGDPLKDQAFLKAYGKAINSVLDAINK